MNIRKRLHDLLHLDDPPHRLALALSVGVFIAFSPLFGLHIVMALFVAWAFRLNVTAVILGSLVNNPWTLAPIFGTSLWVGIKIWGLNREIPPIQWENLALKTFLKQLAPYLIPFVIGTHLLGMIAAALTYVIAVPVITKARLRRQQRLAAGASAPTHGSDRGPKEGEETRPATGA